MAHRSGTTPAQQLQHVYWIGGGSGAGKTTIARELAARHGLGMYSTDDAMAAHDRYFTPRDAPFLSRFKAMDMDQRWANRSPQTMLETFHWFNGELFQPIIEDLMNLPAQRGVIAEGFRLLPHLVQHLLADARHAVWLLPTPEFRRAAFTSRGTLWDIPRHTSNPERALHNLLERDHMFTERLRQQTAHLGLPAIGVDTTMTHEDLTNQVADTLGLGQRADEWQQA
jgi:2-phosphoglycerate kinase